MLVSSKSISSPEELVEILHNVNVSSFQDFWGPEEVIQVYDPATRMQGILVIDNTALGPGKGGIRISPTVTPYEVFKLARAMTWKTALADIPFGGAKSGIRANPFTINKIQHIEAFAKRIALEVPERYIAAPDMNTGEKEMEAFAETIGDLSSTTGKPKSLGGIPHELGTTGFGVGVALETSFEILKERLDLPADLSETTAVIQGFGNVGLGIAKYLAKRNVKIVAINDLWGTAYNQEGINIDSAEKYSYATSKEESIINYEDCQVLPRDSIFKFKCDFFIPCAIGGVINDNTCQDLKTKLIVEGANNATLPNAEGKLYLHNTLIIPDFLANAGGVIGSYVEHIKGSSYEAFNMIESKIKTNTNKVVSEAVDSRITPRNIAMNIAHNRIIDAMEKRK